MKKIISFLLVLFIGQVAVAQVIVNGVVRDLGTDEPLDNVNVKNIYTKYGMATTPSGKFNIEIKTGQLIEFTRIGFETVRIRIQDQNNPTFYNIVMRQQPKMLKGAIIREKGLNYERDSAETRETYKLILDKSNREDLNTGNAIMDGLSRKTRQEWAFKKQYEHDEEERYIDYMFGEKLVGKWTGLKDDALQQFIARYRPSYAFLRKVSDYQYFEYLKSCLMQYCPTCHFNVRY